MRLFGSCDASGFRTIGIRAIGARRHDDILKFKRGCKLGYSSTFGPLRRKKKFNKKKTVAHPV